MSLQIIPKVTLEIEEYYLPIERDILDRLKNINSGSTDRKGLDVERVCLELLEKWYMGKICIKCKVAIEKSTAF